LTVYELKDAAIKVVGVGSVGTFMLGIATHDAMTEILFSCSKRSPEIST